MSFLSIDVGSSRCKAGVFSSSGEMLALRSASWTPQYPQPGRAELDPEVFFEVVTALVREIAAIDLRDPIEAICFSSHGETLIPVGGDGRNLCPAILNTDVRATFEARWCEQQMGRQQLFSITGHTSHPMYPVPKMVWLRKNEPDIFRNTAKFLGVTDFLLLRLGLPPLLDFSHAARFMALDVRTQVWSQEVLEMAQVSPDSLAIPVPTGTIAGKLGHVAAASLGIREGTPVVVGGHDQVIGALGLGVIGAGRAAGSLGTYECILVVSDQPQLNRAALDHGLNSYPHAVPGKYATIAYFPSGIMLQWLSNLLRGTHNGQDAESLWKQLELEAPNNPTGLLVTPHLIGTCNPEFDSLATGAIRGLTLSSTRSHLYKGVLEGIASELTLIIECLENAGSIFGHINVSGGGVRSAMGMRLRSAFTGKHLHVMSGKESVCLGGAMLASVALHVHANLDAAAKAMLREEKCIDPDLDLARQYKAQLTGYRRFRSFMVQSHLNIDSQEGEQS